MKRKVKPNKALTELIKSTGGVTQIAVDVGVTEGAVRYWIQRGRVPVPAARVLASKYSIEEIGLSRDRRSVK